MSDNRRKRQFLSFQESDAAPERRPKKAKTEPELSWRLDPDESFSDWTIVITSEDDQVKTRTYHVHKNVLAVGPRKSKYFASVFRMGNFNEARTAISEISLPGLAFDAFEHMLDFMYGVLVRNKMMLLSAEDMVGLRHLSQYFAVPMLFLEISREIVQISSDRKEFLCRLLTAGDALHDDKLVALAAEICSDHITEFSSDELNALSPELVAQIFESPNVCWGTVRSIELTEALAKYCKQNRDKIDSDFLRRAFSKLPVISISASSYLINLSLELDDGKDAALEKLRAKCQAPFVGLLVFFGVLVVGHGFLLR